MIVSDSDVPSSCEVPSASVERAPSFRMRLMRKTAHSSKEERNAVDDAMRCSELNARASNAAQKELKNDDSGDGDESTTDEKNV